MYISSWETESSDAICHVCFYWIFLLYMHTVERGEKVFGNALRRQGRLFCVCLLRTHPSSGGNISWENFFIGARDKNRTRNSISATKLQTITLAAEKAGANPTHDRVPATSPLLFVRLWSTTNSKYRLLSIFCLPRYFKKYTFVQLNANSMYSCKKYEIGW
jgi:hypothetical protein